MSTNPANLFYFDLVSENNSLKKFSAKDGNHFMKEFREFSRNFGLFYIPYGDNKKLIVSGSRVVLSRVADSVLFKFDDEIILESHSCSENSPMKIPLEKIGKTKCKCKCELYFYIFCFRL